MTKPGTIEDGLRLGNLDLKCDKLIYQCGKSTGANQLHDFYLQIYACFWYMQKDRFSHNGTHINICSALPYCKCSDRILSTSNQKKKKQKKKKQQHWKSSNINLNLNKLCWN